jgi:hypothetical protein
MGDIFSSLMESNLTTKLFVLISVVILSIITYYLLRIKWKIITILLLHGIFGVLLARISVYSPLVQLYLYILPSLILGIFLFFLFPKKEFHYEPGPYDLKLETEKGPLIFNPFAGVCILGVPKAGKTASLVKPIIKQMAEKNFSGLIYDFKRDDLTRCAYYHYLNHPEVDFKMINFFDINRCSRVNPIHPSIMTHPSYAREASIVFLANMMGGSLNQASLESKYWIDSAAGVLSAIFWNLKLFTPQYCDLPHAIAILIKKDTKELQRYLEKSDQAYFMAASFFKSSDSEKQVAGILGTLASSLSKIALPEIFYAMSGEPDVNLNLNDPNHPTLLTLSTTNDLKATYAPALALIISSSLKLMNQPNLHHSALVLEEASTLIIPEFDNTPATARSNKIGTIIIAQDMVQLEDGYSRIGRDKLLANLGTHIYGRARDVETAERYSRMFGTIEKYYTSTNRKSGAMLDSGYTDSLRDVRKYKPEVFLNLGIGQFIGLIGEGNMEELNAKFKYSKDVESQLPYVRGISPEDVQKTFDMIIEESVNIC